MRDAEQRSANLYGFEEEATLVLQSGVTPDQLRQAVDMFLTGRQGTLTGDFIERDGEGWVPVQSAFRAGDKLPAPNRLRGWRVRSGWTVEEIAGRLDVDPATVGAWKSGADVPARVGQAYAELTGGLR